MNSSEHSPATDFIRRIVREDVAAGKNDSAVVTRFPPEPNGYLHIGHAKSICLNFGIADEYSQGKCYLRFDDTNPEKESLDYVQSIKADVRWLGFDWQDRLTHASDYFEQLYDFALALIGQDKAYVCSLSAEEIRSTRGTLTKPGTDSPWRTRSPAESEDYFRRMRQGEFRDGAHVLRLKIDMASPNLNLRDPVIYRIRRQAHQMTGDAWCIYPMYDYTHCISDALEGITHSLCTLEFEDHRPLYDWILDQLDVPCHPRQIEFSRLSLEYTVVSKRLLNALVREGHVDGWDDPRMPTISALRRRGYTASAIRDFCSRIGVTKKDNWIEMGVLENSIREDLDPVAPRRMAVLNPLKVVIENYPEDRVEIFTVPNHPGKPEMGTRSVSFSRHLYIERDDFMEEPAKKFFRLAPGREVRLRFAYFISCHKVIKDQDGNVIELSCSYDPKTRGGTSPPDGRKVKGTIHWVSVAHAQTAEVRLYDRLFKTPAVSTTGDLQSQLNDRSLLTMPDAKLESALSDAAIGENYQFERLGYFSRDNRDSPAQKMVFNRTVTLRDTWLKAQKKSAQAGR